MFVKHSVTLDLHSIVMCILIFIHSTMISILIFSSLWLKRKVQLWTFLYRLLLNMHTDLRWLWGWNCCFITIYSVSGDIVKQIDFIYISPPVCKTPHFSISSSTLNIGSIFFYFSYLVVGILISLLICISLINDVVAHFFLHACLYLNIVFMWGYQAFGHFLLDDPVFFLRIYSSSIYILNMMPLSAISIVNTSLHFSFS